MLLSDFTVTIAIPTFKRPQLLRRALHSVEMQTYSRIEIIVSDNASDDEEVDKVVNEYLLRLPNLKYIKQKQNIGAEGNIFSCLRESKSDLFMWLADDDEISPNCIEELVYLFNTIQGLATAVPSWHLYTDSKNFKIMPSRSYDSKYWPLRACKFLFKSTDEMFYGLHKRAILEKCNVNSYFWPNKKETQNRIYPYLLDIILNGKVVMLRNSNIFWRNHDYSEKLYQKTKSFNSSLTQKGFYIFQYFMRRLNLQVLYLSKVKVRGGIILAVLLSPVSILSVFIDIFKLFIQYIRVQFTRQKNFKMINFV